MSLYKLPRGLLEIPKGTNTSCNEINSNFANNLEKTNTLLAQFVSATDFSKKLIMRQELEESYFNLTMYHLKDTVKHKIEQDMWNNLFKKYISDLQGKIKNKDKFESSKAQSEISIFLDEAVGFYSKCIDTLSLVHNIRLPGNDNYASSPVKHRKEVCETANEEDIRYIVQHCYVHMGDLSRYHNLTKQAKYYYELAVQLNPSSGHAYNQLAILESASIAHANITSNNYQHVIRTILMYEYANSCEIPFPATKINLESLLRHINDQSVSTLLTSNNSITDQNCIYSTCIAWIHVYGNLKMTHNIPRCKQLQQRIIDWTSELVKNFAMCKKYWRELTSLAALHSSLMSNYISQVDLVDNKPWNTNIQQFNHDFINALCRGIISLVHDNKQFEELFSNCGCISIIIVFLSWLHQYLHNNNNKTIAKTNENVENISLIPLKIPFGEDFVKFLNFLIEKNSKFDVIDDVKLPLQLPELSFITGFQPLKVPCKTYNIYSHTPYNETDTNEISELDTRISFIISVCKRFALKWSSLIVFDSENDKFVAVPLPEPVPVKKCVKIEPSIANRKPVNVALASMKSNQNIKPNGFIGQNIPSKVSVDDTATESSSTKGIITDVKIAKCIQEQIAHDTKSSIILENNSPTTKNRDDNSHIIAPAPGLILSSNLPPDFKSISSASLPTASSVTQQTEHTLSVSEQSTQHDQSDHTNKVLQAAALKNHSYNPNREQFEKDLPPRFANKRSYSQEMTANTISSSSIDSTRNFFDQQLNKGGFLSMNYWDSINDFHNNSHPNQFDNNLAKKESEILLPPTVPTSWLTDNIQQEHHKMDSSNITNNPTIQQYQFSNNVMHSQSSHPFSGITNQQPPPQSHMNLIQSFNQFNSNQQQQQSTQPQSQLNKEQENQLQYLLKSVTTNSNTPRFRSQTDALLSTKINFDNQIPFMNNTRMPSKFPTIPPPPTQQGINPPHLQNVNQQNYDSFQMTRPTNFYDKPVFSSTNNQQSPGLFGYSNTGGGGGGGGGGGSILQQQHQVRHNNPLLNLLPGFLNETQR